ncbi:luciferase [Reticulibacter mediterranei]|uniref:Luciferase n=1 Tax=Reticulibacter mediterranei TaxID=2778369 RepID=A0A8J3N9F0_9CHLR|nr:LLM class flavin-dependent oxidoreductase [Reticulibacter mediterranei]GHO99257.1 luciferase [Reticulibacter mediterranei]
MSNHEMQIGIGLPANIPGVAGDQIIEWAKKADAGPFSSLGLIDRLVYDNYDPLIAFAAAAGATQRIRFTTSILLAPLHRAALLAKQAASLDAISGGRLTLGLGVGVREDDFQAASVPYHSRGKIFDAQLATMQRIWSGQALSDEVGAIGPAPVRTGGPEILIGAGAPAALRRLGQWGNGYIAGGGGAQMAAQGFRAAEKVWSEAGRAGKPRLVGCVYYALGPDAQKRGGEYINHYYGPQFGSMVVQGLIATPEAVKEARKAFADIGTDELIFWPCIAELNQMGRLEDALR